MKNVNTKKLTLTALFAAVAVVGSLFCVPVFGSKCAPVQHLVNILCAIFLGPGYGVACAFVASLVRNMLSLGTLLAFPGSMCGAFLAGMLYKYSKNIIGAYLGELVGTSLFGGMLSFPIALLVMGNAEVAIFTFVVPFFISSAGGTLIAVMVTMAMKQAKLLQKFQSSLEA